MIYIYHNLLHGHSRRCAHTDGTTSRLTFPFNHKLSTRQPRRSHVYIQSHRRMQVSKSMTSRTVTTSPLRNHVASMRSNKYRRRHRRKIIMVSSLSSRAHNWQSFASRRAFKSPTSTMRADRPTTATLSVGPFSIYDTHTE